MSNEPGTPLGHFVDGDWIDGGSEETFESGNPATGETVETFRRGTESDVDRAVEAANAAFEP